MALNVALVHWADNYAPTMKKLMGHIAFGACVCGSHFFVPNVTFKLLKLKGAVTYHRIALTDAERTEKIQKMFIRW